MQIQKNLWAVPIAAGVLAAATLSPTVANAADQYDIYVKSIKVLGDAKKGSCNTIDVTVAPRSSKVPKRNLYISLRANPGQANTTADSKRRVSYGGHGDRTVRFRNFTIAGDVPFRASLRASVNNQDAKSRDGDFSTYSEKHGAVQVNKVCPEARCWENVTVQPTYGGKNKAGAAKYKGRGNFTATVTYENPRNPNCEVNKFSLWRNNGPDGAARKFEKRVKPTTGKRSITLTDTATPKVGAYHYSISYFDPVLQYVVSKELGWYDFGEVTNPNASTGAPKKTYNRNDLQKPQQVKPKRTNPTIRR